MEENQNNKETTIEDKIKSHLQSGKGITTLEAFNLYGSHRLSSVIAKFRKRGMRIKSEFVKVNSGKYVSRYSLVKD